MKKQINSIPNFKSDEDERNFWMNHDVTDYLHQLKPSKLDLSKLKPSTHRLIITASSLS